MFDPKDVLNQAYDKYKFDIYSDERDWFHQVLGTAVIKAYNAGIKQAIELCDESREILEQQLIKD